MGVVASSTGSTGSFDVEPLATDAQQVLDALGRGEWELSILVCDDNFIRPLNEQWRDKDEATDVLSFPQLTFEEPEKPIASTGETVLLGDVVISVETAGVAAEALGHDLHTEMRVLLVHGICHLLGHQHHSTDSRERMTERESELLSALKLSTAGLVARAERKG